MSNLEQSCFLSFRIVSWKSLGTLFKIIEAEKVYLGIQMYALSEINLEKYFIVLLRIKPPYTWIKMSQVSQLFWSLGYHSLKTSSQYISCSVPRCPHDIKVNNLGRIWISIPQEFLCFAFGDWPWFQCYCIVTLLHPLRALCKYYSSSCYHL